MRTQYRRYGSNPVIEHEKTVDPGRAEPADKTRFYHVGHFWAYCTDYRVWASLLAPRRLFIQAKSTARAISD